ncbi:MAG: T9SS type A sorting domain-containing protein [Ignavibacteriae bacterium]|nr:T9SS type A sorting domain-containing protein [Ignavibacteriota bacterium]
MKHFNIFIILIILCTNAVFGAPRVKLVSEYITPNDYASNSAFTSDSTVASGLYTVAKGTYVYLRAWNFGDGTAITSANWSFVQKPTGSNATLNGITGLDTWQKFKADSSGTYEIMVSVTTSSGTHDTTAKIYASTYVGVGGFDGVAAQFPNCMSCHGNTPKFQDIFNRWKTTKHANSFKDNITSGSSSYGTESFRLHTLGYDHFMFANNDGFDDRASQLGWDWNNYPHPGAGNWDTIKTHFSSLVAFANVGCESCHGPGSQHVFNGGDTNRIQRDLNGGVCGKCHDSSPQTPEFEQWRNALHSDVVFTSSFAQNNNGSNNLDNCIRCHDGKGYVNYTKGIGTNTNGFTQADQDMIACATCHDPHGNNNPYGLRNRPSGDDTLANGFHYTNVGNGAVCMDCHKARKDNRTYVLTQVTNSRWGPHHSTQSDLFQAQNFAEFGSTLQTTRHKDFLPNACVTCHMAPTDTSAANKNKVGGHALLLHNEDTDYDHLKACENCHFGKTRFDQFIAPVDYDGDSQIEPWMDEVDGCLTNLRTTLPPEGVDSVAWQLIQADSSNVTLRKAYFNYLMITEDGSHGMHNPKFAVDILIQSKNALLGVGVTTNTNEVPATYDLSQNYPNPFNPSTRFTFSLPKGSNVSIVVFDVTGRQIATLVNSKFEAGKYSVDWNGTDNGGALVSSGVYFYRIVAGDFVQTRKMALIK